jgi:hypothetical protein
VPDASDFVFSRDWKLELQGVAPADAAVQVLAFGARTGVRRTRTPTGDFRWAQVPKNGHFGTDVNAPYNVINFPYSQKTRSA